MSTRRPSATEQSRFWNWHWTHWRERKTLNDWKDRRHEIIVGHLASLALRNARILDLGCGPGHYTSAFARFGEVTGIDLSDVAISVARAKYPNIRFVAGDLYDSPLPEEHFDAVIAQEVIDHVADQEEFLRRAARLLRPGGYLFFSCANRLVMDRLGPGELPPQPPEHISQHRTIWEWRRVLRHNFEVVQIRSILPVLGQRGILRLVNSHKLTVLCGALLGRHRVTTLKERAGVGYTLIIQARKPAGVGRPGEGPAAPTGHAGGACDDQPPPRR